MPYKCIDRICIKWGLSNKQFIPGQPNSKFNLMRVDRLSNTKHADGSWLKCVPKASDILRPQVIQNEGQYFEIENVLAREEYRVNKV